MTIAFTGGLLGWLALFAATGRRSQRAVPTRFMPAMALTRATPSPTSMSSYKREMCTSAKRPPLDVDGGDTPVLHSGHGGDPVPTNKKRINITVDDELYRLLERLSRKRGQSIAGVSLDLIEQALEYQEDRHFSRVADQRLEKRQRRIPHDKAWE
ncbi:MAG: ribbon-helix-helix protein, CopG family [Deltaproteobacteria bacterium]|nr:MAG: ribbon-helix-helix protein, CopG family [Deltaproteobacteria bacterium]